MGWHARLLSFSSLAYVHSLYGSSCIDRICVWLGERGQRFVGEQVSDRAALLIVRSSRRLSRDASPAVSSPDNLKEHESERWRKDVLAKIKVQSFGFACKECEGREGTITIDFDCPRTATTQKEW